MGITTPDYYLVHKQLGESFGECCVLGGTS